MNWPPKNIFLVLLISFIGIVITASFAYIILFELEIIAPPQPVLTNSAPPSFLPIFYIYSCLICGGAFGGFISGLKKCGFLETTDRCLSSEYLSYLGYHLLIGIGGAFAVALAFVYLGKLILTRDLEHKIILFTLSIVAGFIGNRILPAIASKLEEQVHSQGETLSRLAEETKEIEKKLSESINKANYSNAISFATTAASKDAILGDRYRSIKEMKSLLQIKPKDRTLTIKIGVLYKVEEKYDEAIAVLDDFIRLKRTDGELDIDYADAHYNKACYLWLKALKCPTEKEALKRDAYDNLKIAIDLNPYNSTNAKQDKDFEKLRAEDGQDFTEAIRRE